MLADVADFATRGGAVLLTTQQLDEAEEIATRVVLVARGRVVLEGTVGEIRAHAGRARVRVRAAALPPACRAATVERRGDRHLAYVDDADAFVAQLVSSGTPFSELEVVPVTLEDAFVALTSEKGT
jgi:ABC-2 type transport system ATP-binding protein